MKKLSCDICTTSFTGDTFDAWFKQMQAHYMNDHADVMASMADKPKSEGEAWVAAAKKRFNAAQ
ncbi:MAG: hypothetical protein O3C65_02755 [Proteobacteria bacterium]|nr:hypothetical protein [Pseudomonadota bacterium]MDA1057582.1 hypothetical protein [Pseudomonadota bacterium]